MQARPNVVVIVADSLRADRLRLYNPADGVATPAIESLAARGLVLRNAWAAAPWTVPSVLSVFTGLYPPSHGVVFRDDTTPADLPSLPRILAAHGYRLGNFTFFGAVSYFRNLGFPESGPGSGHGPEGMDEFLAAGPPFLAWVHLLEAHLPYGAAGHEAPAVREHGSSGLELAQTRAVVPFGAVEFAPGDGERLRQLYDEDVAALDRSVAATIDSLAALNLLDDTIVVFVADHGEELLEHGWIGHASTAVHASLVPEILRIPLLIAGPGVPAGASSDRLVSQVDILPTLLRLLRIRPPRPLDGTPMLPLAHLPSSRLVFFDTSAGGNLTPEDRHDERLQGVSDGRTLLSSRLAAGGVEELGVQALPETGQKAAGVAARARLADALADWRRKQARQRVELLGGRSAAGAPADVEGYREALAVTMPAAGERLERSRSGAQVALRWSGAGETVLIEYSIGDGLQRVHGRFEVRGAQLMFGPFPEAFWNELAGHNPFRFRVVDPPARARSPWVEFSVLPVAPS